MRSRVAVAALVLGGGALACRPSADAPAVPAVPSVDLVGAGATFPYPVYRAWISDYAAQARQRVNYLAVGSAEGLRLLERGEVDFGATDRPPAAPRGDGDSCAPLAVPMVSGPIAVVYTLPSLRDHPPLVLDVATVAGIFAGRLRRWDAPAIAALNPSVALPALPITVVHRGAGSGTGRAFQSWLATSGRWRVPADSLEVAWPVGIAAEGNDGVAMEVAVREGAVGFAELAYARLSHLQVAALRQPDGAAVLPAADAPSYPIVARSWLVLDPRRLSSAKRDAVTAFVRWALRNGAARASALEYAPTAPDTIARYDAALAAFGRRPCATAAAASGTAGAPSPAP